jgi:hypothetical protein
VLIRQEFVAMPPSAVLRGRCCLKQCGLGVDVTRVNSRGQLKPFVYLNWPLVPVDNAARRTAQRKSRLSAGFPGNLVDATVLLLRFLTGLPLTAGILLLLLTRLLAAALLLLLAALLARVLILLTRVLILIRHAGISLF